MRSSRDRLVNDLKTIYDSFTVGFWEKEGGRSYFTVFQESELEAAVLRSIPAAIELLLLGKVDPSPRTEGLHPRHHTL